MRIRSRAAIAAGFMALVGLGGLALAAQDRNTLKVPDGLAFSEFKGYEGWQAVSVSQVPGSLKLISANPVMMAAYRTGLPARGQTFPDGSKIAKIEWSSGPNAASPYPVQTPGAIKTIAFIEKDLKRFPATHGWAYAIFDYDRASQTLRPRGTGAGCGYECHTRVAAQDYIYTAYPAR